jgi:hypothetical protein
VDNHAQNRFHWKELALLVIVGIPAFAVALSCGLFVWTYTGPQYDIVIVNDHAIGGPFDRVVALVLGTFSGAVGIFSVLTFQRRMSDRAAKDDAGEGSR